MAAPKDEIIKQEQIPWRAQPGPQLVAIQKHWIPEVFFGGAVGGGKSDFLLGDFAQDVPVYGANWQGIIFRKSAPQLEELISRAAQMYPPWFGFSWTDQFTVGNSTLKWPNGARLKFRHLEDDDSWTKYQGHQYSWIGFDELPHWATPKAYMELKTRLRNGSIAIPNKRIRSTGNPGGVGHGWIKKYFGIDRYPLGSVIVEPDVDGGNKKMFIRSRVQDNKILLANDPNYIARLQDLGSEVLVKQYLEGDWSVVAGAYFSEFSPNKHILQPFEIPKGWTRYRSMDWGSAKPFSVGWYAVADGEQPEGCDRTIPRGAVIKYREWYGAKVSNREVDIGLKMDCEDIAHGILAREPIDEVMSMSIIDPAAFKEDGGPSQAERMSKISRIRPDNSVQAVTFQRGDNTRIAGWDMVRARLKGDEGVPMLFFFSTCVDSVRTIPGLQHDTNKPEDLDTDGEDHCFAAGTLVSLPDGDVPIEQLPAQGVVATRFGVERYRSARQTGVRETVLLSFSDGSTVRCTPDHRFLTEGGWTEAKDLRGRTLSQYELPKTVKSFWGNGITDAARTFSARVSDFIARCGSFMAAPFRRIAMSTTSITTEATTTRSTYDFQKQLNISRTMRKIERPSKNGSSMKLGLQQLLSGTALRKVLNGIASIYRNTTCAAKEWFSFVRNVLATLTDGLTTGDRSSAAMHVGSVRCVSVELMPSAPVYCLTVPTIAEFLLSNGLAVSNCADELRYACMARPWIRKNVVSSGPTWANGQIVVPGKVICTTTFNDLMKAARQRRLADN